MLKAAGASELHDPLFWYLLRHMQQNESRRARGRTRARRAQREGGDA